MDNEKLIEVSIYVRRLEEYIKNNYKNVLEFSKLTGLKSNNIYSVLNGKRGLAKGQMQFINERVGYDVFNDKPLDTHLVYVPEYNLQLSAGGGQDIFVEEKVDNIPLTDKIIQEYRLNLKSLCVLSIKGDSMLPTFVSGEKILIDTSCDKELSDFNLKNLNHKVMAVRFNSFAYIKRISIDQNGQLELVSDNKNNNVSMQVKKHDDFEIIGKPILSLYRKFNQ